MCKGCQRTVNFSESRKAEVQLRRINLPRTTVNKLETQAGGGNCAKLASMDYDESSSSPEEPLPGTLSTLTKVGNTVRRSTGPWTPAVHALLRHLERAGFDGAPRVLGVDDRGREVLTYIPGEVPRTASPEVATDRALSEVGLLLRRYHEAVSGFFASPWHRVVRGGRPRSGRRSLPQRPGPKEHGLPRGQPCSVLGLRPRLARPASVGRGTPRLAVRAAGRRRGLRTPRVVFTARPSRAAMPLVRWLRAPRARADRVARTLGPPYGNERFGDRGAGCGGRARPSPMGRGGRTRPHTHRPGLGRAAPRDPKGGPPWALRTS